MGAVITRLMSRGEESDGSLQCKVLPVVGSQAGVGVAGRRRAAGVA